MKTKLIKGGLITFSLLIGTYALFLPLDGEPASETLTKTPTQTENSRIKTAAINNQVLPSEKTLHTDYHVFQTFNNCAAAGLSIALSYFDVFVSQEELAADLRPNNNRRGIDDDKSTPPQELGEKAKEYGLIPYYRAHGSIELMKKFIANGLPILVRTLLDTEHDFAHYRVVKGYDDVTKEIIQDDSYQGKNIRYYYDDFIAIWHPFNYEYLVLAPLEKKDIVEAILGEETDEMASWQNAIQRAVWELEVNPDDINAALNLSVSLYYVGKREEAIAEFEKIEKRLPTRAMWYRMEPIQAYFDLGKYDRVFALSEKIFNDNNKGYAELYLLRGKIYLKRGEKAKAKIEFDKALLYNKNLRNEVEQLNSAQ